MKWPLILSRERLALTVIVAGFMMIFTTSRSQDSVAAKSPLMFSISMYVNRGSVLPHSEKIKSVSTANPLGFTVGLNWQRTTRYDFDRYRCLPRHSLQIAYYDLDKESLGKGVNISYGLEPHFMVAKPISVYPKFSIGLGFLTTPYDSISNSLNKAYSLPVNVYLSLGVGVRYQISKHWATSLVAEFQHISNGGLYKPNIGMNWPTIGFGFEFSPGGLELPKNYRSTTSKEKPHSRRLDAQLFGVLKYGDFNGTGLYYPISGLNFTHSWQVSQIHAWTAAAEIYQDSYLRDHDMAGGITTSGTRVGILAGHEFLLTKFIFSQQIGFYLSDTHRQNLMYHRWGLQYYFISRWSVGFNLMVHGQTADFTDLRLTYSVFKK